MEWPVIWISSPAGSGKTKFIASYLTARHIPCIWYQCDEGDADPGTFFYYMAQAAQNAVPRRRIVLPQLTPEYFQGIPAFSRRYFEQLYSLLLPRSSIRSAQREFFIVLDDYQDVPAEESLHHLLANALDMVPAGIHIVIISRNDPPAAFAGLQANDKLLLLRYTELRFTPEEARELVYSRIPSVNSRQMKVLYDLTEGWAAGIVLLLERARLEGMNALAGADAVTSGLFDYFAGEIFRKTPKDIQRFLLQTAFLPELDVAGAKRLTGEQQSETILADLARHNYFTERLASPRLNYRYHPLFRDYLTKQAKSSFSPAELSALRMKAAQIREEAGNIEDAARLYGDAGEIPQLARIVINYARHFLRQGRSKTVNEWLAAIPPTAVENNPWLLYWSGLCSFPADIIHTRSCMEKALAAFRAVADPAGVYLSWAGLVDSCAYKDGDWNDLDMCITLFNDLQKDYPFPTASGEIDLIVSSRILISLILRKIEKTREIMYWFGRVSRLLKKTTSPEIHLAATCYMNLYFLWKGEFKRNTLLLEKAEESLKKKSSPLSVIRIKLMMGMHCWITAQYDAATKHLTSGIAAAEESGVGHLSSLLWGFLVAVHIVTGNLTKAELALQKQNETALDSRNSLDIFLYHINSAWQALLNEDVQLAAIHMETIALPTARMGLPCYQAEWHIGMAQVMYRQGRTGDAQSHASQARQIGRNMKSSSIEWYSMLVTAWFLFGEGSGKKGLKALRRALALARRHGYTYFTLYQPSVLGFLCAKALEQGIEEDYTKSIIRKLSLSPPVSGLPGCRVEIPDLNKWPYPLKIHTLGRFEILQDDQPLTFVGKAQKKPLEMLKALIAGGGANVPTEYLTDALWPDADGDLAHKSFKTTLSRLRRLLGGEHFVRYSTGQLSLDALCCRVDSLVLEDIFDRIRKSPADQVAPLCEQAVDLYKGPFLPSDTILPWTVHRREMLKNRLLHMLITTGRHYEQAGNWKRAAEYYQRGMDTDHLAEEFYQCLMICYAKHGLNADAVRTYNRCRSALADHLGLRPSPETQAIYASIIQPR